MNVRISKYNPAFRMNWIYTVPDWTSISDIGEEFDGVKLSKDMYLNVESQYLACLNELILLSKTNSMQIIAFERGPRQTLFSALHMTRLFNFGLYFFRPVPWKKGQVLSLSEVKSFIIDSLREKCWGKLCSDTMALDMGYDYYVHLDTTLSLESVQRVVSKHGLYLDRIHE